MVTKPNAINFCKNPKPDTSERAFRHLPPNRPTPRLLPLLPTPPVHSAGTVGRRKKPQTNEQETLLQSLNMCHKRSTPGPKRTELKARWHELQHLGGQQRGRSSSKGEVQRSSKTPLEGVRRLAEHNVNNQSLRKTLRRQRHRSQAPDVPLAMVTIDQVIYGPRADLSSFFL